MIETLKEFMTIFFGIISFIVSIASPSSMNDNFWVKDNSHPTYSEIIQKIKDENLGVEGCGKIKVQFSINYDEQSARSYCITEIAVYEGDPELCKTTGQESYNFCIEQVAYTTGNSQTCLLADNEISQKNCRETIANK
jgi:hypothetical protein